MACGLGGISRGIRSTTSMPGSTKRTLFVGLLEMRPNPSDSEVTRRRSRRVEIPEVGLEAEGMIRTRNRDYCRGRMRSVLSIKIASPDGKDFRNPLIAACAATAVAVFEFSITVVRGLGLENLASLHN